MGQSDDAIGHEEFTDRRRVRPAMELEGATWRRAARLRRWALRLKAPMSVQRREIVTHSAGRSSALVDGTGAVIAQAGVVIIADYFPPATRAGGPARSIPGVVRAESERSRITVLSRARDHGCDSRFTASELRAADASLPGTSIIRFDGPWQLLSIWRMMRKSLRDSQLMYLNSLLSPLYSIWPVVLMFSRLAPRRRILLAPRGELSLGARAVKPRRKKVALPILKFLLARLDVVWHATSDLEHADIRKFLGSADQPIVVRTNPPPVPRRVSFPSNSAVVVAFVGRMVPLKNFRLLAKAAAQVNFELRVKVAGVLEDEAYWQSCRRVIDKLPNNVKIEVMGHCDHEAVMKLLDGVDAMVLPTHGENFGHAIAEALAVGCPVMVPDTTMWTPLIREGAGWIVDTDDSEILARAMIELSNRNAEDRDRCRTRVSRLYTEWWESISEPKSLFVEALSA